MLLYSKNHQNIVKKLSSIKVIFFLICICPMSRDWEKLGGTLSFHSVIFWGFQKIYSLLVLLIWRRQWQPTPVLLPGKSHGQRSLVGFSIWGCKESDTTERLHFYFSLSCIGEGNGNPLQWSCLENPRDGGAWWAAVYRVAQSRTQLKWLSSSSSITNIRIQIADSLCYTAETNTTL